MIPCVCGCPPNHRRDCPHGCTIVELDDGTESVLGSPRPDPYTGIYANRRWSA